MWYIYILQCSDESLYVGSTGNVQRRLAEHTSGHGGDYTCQRRPVKLLFIEEYPDKPTAEKREAQIKRWTNAKKLALVNGDLELLKLL